MTLATAEPPAAVRLELLDDLILARLLAPPKGFSASKLRAALNPFYRVPPSTEAVQRHIEGLRSAALIEQRGLLLTGSGRERALEFLGVQQLPARSTWQTIKNRYLVAKALGQRPGEGNPRQTGKFDGLAAVLLKKKLGIQTGRTLTEVLTAIACRELDLPENSDWSRLRREALSKSCEADETLDSKQLRTTLPRKLLAVTGRGMDGLRQVALKNWTEGGAAKEVEDRRTDASEPFDLPAFANTVLKAARECPTGRFGMSKVFINHVWNFLRGEPGFPQMPLAEFKQRLVEAHLASLLVLSRADMVPNMPAKDVEESETRYLSAEFHFIRTEEDRP